MSTRESDGIGQFVPTAARSVPVNPRRCQHSRHPSVSYARGPGIQGDEPEYLGHAVRLAEELGADIVKTGYSGSAESFQHVCTSTSLPIVIAGGSRGTDAETVEMVRGAMDAGGAGVSMGRSIFQHEDPEAITRAVSAVIHDDADTETALDVAGLSG